MKKHLPFLVFLFCLGCGSKKAFTYDQYNNQHFKTRMDHISLIQESSVVIDTSLQQLIQMVEQNEDQEECLRTWHKTRVMMHEVQVQNRIYIYQVIVTDKTDVIAKKMWEADRRMIKLADDLNLDIEKSIRANEKLTATKRLRDLKTLTAAEWKLTLEAEQEYVKVAFGEKK